MSLLHPAILYGLGLAALPVILHLLLRQKPKKLLFPALRLIANRRKQNVSRMRLRHLWLLLLRVLVIGLLVFAIARPSVPAADYSLNLREIVTLLALVALAIAAYAFVTRSWQKAGMPRHVRRTRQANLRAGLIIATIMLLLLMVGWPYQRRISAELKSPKPSGDVSLPVAAVFLFDTSLSMTYQQGGKNRLDVARELALEHLSDLATGSRVAIADVSNDNPILFQTTVAGAKTRIESLEPHPRILPLNDRIRSALRLHEDDRVRTLAEQSGVDDDERKDRYLRRIYVFTDLARSAFRPGGTSRLATQLEEQPHVNLFLFDVSEPDPINMAITSVEPSRVRLAEDGTATVDATVTPEESAALEAAEGETTCTIELLLRDRRGIEIKVDQRTVELPNATPQQVTFGPLSPEFGPVVHGDVRLVASDPLAFDNVRHFTLEVRPPQSILVVSSTEVEADSWVIALEVMGYHVVVRNPGELTRATVADFDVVCLINVSALPDNEWYRLGQYVEAGGGLAVVLGSTDLEYGINYARDEAQVFLPGRPLAHSAPDGAHLQIENDQHPLFRSLQGNEGIALLESASIDRFWRVEPAADASILARYSDRREAPALLERIHGEGRTLMLTTAVDIKGFPRNWNNLANPQWSGWWTFLALADEMMRYLSHESQTRLTFDSGETPALRLAAEPDESLFLLQRPGFRQSRLSLPADESLLTIPDAEEIGHYDLKTTGERGSTVAGFSVNARPAESDLTLATTDELDEMFGEERYQVARSIGELKESINIADLGRELFPLLLTALILLFVGEHFVANWFYDDQSTTGTTATWESTTESTPRAIEPAVAASSAT